MKVYAALFAGFVLRFCGMWLGVFAAWLVHTGLKIEAAVSDDDWPGSA